MKREIILTLIIILLVYFIGVSITGFVPIGETCCLGDDCNEDSKCSFAQPKVPTQNTINILLEVFLVALASLYFYLIIKQRYKN
jgi:hypothetical protein